MGISKTGKKGESQKSNLAFLLLVLTFFLYKFQTIYLWENYVIETKTNVGRTYGHGENIIPPTPSDERGQGHTNNFMSSAAVLNVKFDSNEFYIKSNTSL
jgi:hypothetical protein